MVRIFGSEGGWVRIRSLLGLVFSVSLLAVFIAPPAQAVHDIHVFELEGNATNDPAIVGDDWTNVCHEAHPNKECGTTDNTTNASGVSFESEPNRSTSIFTGGGSKDDLDISGWAWKDAGGLPDKDNLRDGFAARYTCVAADGCTGTAGDVLLYFGADRFDNSGDAQIGFWFLQGNVTPLADGSFGPDAHKAGDVLVLSDFTGGGGTPTIRVFAWDPTCSSGCNTGDLIDGTLLKLGGGTVAPADCPSQGANDPFCAVVNSNTETAPWAFKDKSKNTDFAPGEFYEGGINLTKLQLRFPGLASECFATTSAETRSSQAVDAVLKDFILGSFQACKSSVTSEQTWVPNDSGTVDVEGASAWTGTLTFTLFDNLTCDGNVLYGPEVQNVSSTTTDTASTHNTGTGTGTVSATADVSWLIEFKTTTSGVSGSDHCETSSLTVTN